MGMQCHFDVSEKPDYVNMRISYDPDSDTSAAIFDDNEGNSIAAHYDPKSGSCWFDVGSTTEHQINTVKQLIQWRICFSCS